MALIDLKDARKKRLIEAMLSRETPDGSKQYCFSVVYTMADGARYSFDLWAFSEQDAKERVEAIRGTAKCVWMNVLTDEAGEPVWNCRPTHFPADNEKTPEA